MPRTLIRERNRVDLSEGNLHTRVGMRNVNSPVDRERQLAILKKKEAMLDIALRTPAGLAKIAANLTNPVKRQIDYVGIIRKFFVVEPIPDGVPIFYDSDIEEFTAVKIGDNGGLRLIEIQVDRTDIEPFWIVARPKIPYSELYIRKYKVLQRTKERLAQSVAIKEDLHGFGLLLTASTTTNTAYSVAGKLDRDTLAKAFAQVERHRLRVRGVILSAFGISGIRRWDYHREMNEEARTALFASGYIGGMWGAEFYESDKIPVGTVFLCTEPEYLGWLPIRKDYDTIPADDPDNLLLGFVGAEFLGMTVHNTWGVAKCEFDSTQ